MVRADMVALDARSSTPLVELGRFSPAPRRVFAKLEHLLLTGGIFDRVAAAQVARVRGELEAKKTAIIAGSGSTCLAFAAALARVKTKVVAVCSKAMLPEHRLLLRMHKLELVLAEGGLDAVAARATEEAARTGGVVLYSPQQERDTADLFAQSTGADLSRQLSAVDLGSSQAVNLVAPLGSPALIAGIARALAGGGVRARVLATVVPAGAKSAAQDDVFSADLAPALEGVEHVVVEDRAALEIRAEAARGEGLLVGLSSAAALRVARERSADAVSVAIIVDAGDRYFSVDRRAAAEEVST